VTKPLGEVTKTCAMNDVTLVCAWSAEEAARYLETFKSYEHKPADLIQEQVQHDYMSRLTGLSPPLLYCVAHGVHTPTRL
jgi:DNA excision repair protein ERCC-1